MIKIQYSLIAYILLILIYLYELIINYNNISNLKINIFFLLLYILFFYRKYLEIKYNKSFIINVPTILKSIYIIILNNFDYNPDTLNLIANLFLIKKNNYEYFGFLLMILFHTYKIIFTFDLSNFIIIIKIISSILFIIDNLLLIIY